MFDDVRKWEKSGKKTSSLGGECLNRAGGKGLEKRNPVNFILIVNTAMRA